MRFGRIVRSFGCAGAMLVLLTGAGSASADMREDCAQDSDPDLRVRGCTAVLDSGEWTGKHRVWALNNRGLGHAAKGDHASALADFDAALTIDPTHSTVLDNRGNTHAMAGDIERALADHDSAIKADPENARAWNNRAADYMDMRKLGRALPDLDRALALDPGYGDAYRNRAQVRCHMGFAEGAEADWIAALDTGRVDAAALQRRLRDGGFYDGAIDGSFGSGSRAALSNWVVDGCR